MDVCCSFRGDKVEKFTFDDYTKRRAVLDARYKDLRDLEEKIEKALSDDTGQMKWFEDAFLALLFDIVGKQRVALEEVVEVADYLIVESLKELGV